MADTGNGATITLGTSGFTAAFIEIDPGEETGEALESSSLATTGQKEYEPGDLTEPPEIRMRYFFDQNADEPPLHSAETATLTYPLKPGGSTNATLAGTGFFIRRARAAVRNGQLMEGEATFKFDGKTEAAFTKGT